MASLLNLERSAESPALAPDAAEEFVEFEFVLGRRQIAAAGLVVVVLVAVFSGVSYLIGKSTAAKAAATPAAPAAFPIFVPQTPAPAPSASQDQTPQAQPGTETAPVFGDAVTGKVYLQVGAIEKGLAAIWAEGLRTHGLEAFVAPGLNETQWRVLIGPLPDPQAYQRAKDTLDALGVNTFGRRYAQPQEPGAANPPGR